MHYYMCNESKSDTDMIEELEGRIGRLQAEVRSATKTVEAGIDKLKAIKGEFRAIAKELERATAKREAKGEEQEEMRDTIEILEDELETKRAKIAFLDRYEEEAKKAEEYSKQLIYLQAEFENYKRRAEKDKRAFADYLLQSFVTGLLPIKDHLELAVEHAKGNDKSENLLKGVEMTVKQFKDFLEGEGLDEIKAEGEIFDPFRHEVVSKEVSKTQPENTVIAVTRKGYLLRDKVIRPAMVKIAIHKAGGKKSDKKT